MVDSLSDSKAFTRSGYLPARSNKVDSCGSDLSVSTAVCATAAEARAARESSEKRIFMWRFRKRECVVVVLLLPNRFCKTLTESERLRRRTGVETGFNQRVLGGLAAVQNYICGGMMNPSASKSCTFIQFIPTRGAFHMSLCSSAFFRTKTIGMRFAYTKKM